MRPVNFNVLCTLSMSISCELCSCLWHVLFVRVNVLCALSGKSVRDIETDIALCRRPCPVRYVRVYVLSPFFMSMFCSLCLWSLWFVCLWPMCFVCVYVLCALYMSMSYALCPCICSVLFISIYVLYALSLCMSCALCPCAYPVRFVCVSVLCALSVSLSCALYRYLCPKRFVLVNVLCALSV